MAMATMGAENNILVCQMGSDTTGDRFLTDIRMTCAQNQATLVAAGKLFFRLPDHLHRAI
jgi:hypothetical protein